MQLQPSNKILGVFSLVMINVIAIDNLRSLTAGAEYGLALVFFYALAILLFFLPSVLITAELATAWPTTGGAYIWVREAFGPRFGFLAIWLQWIYNVVWYPTIFSFVAGILAYSIYPPLVDNKLFMFSVTLGTFWGITLLNCLGLKISNIISIVGAIVGTMFPMILIGSLGMLWLYLDRPSQISFSISNLIPNFSNLNNLAFLTNVLFGLMGIEMSAVHAGDVRNPTKDYPRALIYSSIIILATLILACLAIAIVIPNKQLNLVSGLIDAFGVFFNAFGMSWFIPVIAALIIIGSLSGATAWIIGPARGLLVASNDNQLPRLLNYTNQKSMPIGILMIQGVIVSILCTLFLIIPSVSGSYWILSNLTAQLALLFYILLFAAAIRLRYKKAHTKRIFKIPGKNYGIWLVGGMGIIACIVAIVLGFLPPSQIAVGSIVGYEMILLSGIIIFCLPPFILTRFIKDKPVQAAHTGPLHEAA
ncbi:MAG: transporter [Gammaproteobacteria bacterium RIFCSPHIGHO2_12_FULL_37_34]|nr:MAG: transporter [Gammaproteobacteria bacterium RIFCSPHIGHO2_12_FULL_37_34]